MSRLLVYMLFALIFLLFYSFTFLLFSNFAPEFRIYILREAAQMSSINFLFAKDTTL